jgi:hypothetical protein
MEASIAKLTIVGLTPYSQSRMHNEPALKGEGKDAYDLRTWRSHMTTATRDGVERVVIPAHGVHQALINAARYSKRQIPGQGKATWTKKFESGISLLDDPSLGVAPDAAVMVEISAHSNGRRGPGPRVQRRFPVFNEWQSTFDVYVLDPIITRDVFVEMVELAGMFIGLGRFRPENTGGNGRFRVGHLDWTDNRALALAAE